MSAPIAKPFTIITLVVAGTLPTHEGGSCFAAVQSEPRYGYWTLACRIYGIGRICVQKPRLETWFPKPKSTWDRFYTVVNIPLALTGTHLLFS